MQGPLISGQQKVHDVRSDRVSFQSRTRSTSTSRKYSTRLNVNVVARSTLMRAHIAMNNAVLYYKGPVIFSKVHDIQSDRVSWRSQHALGLTRRPQGQYQCSSMLLSRIHVRTCTCTWDTDRVPSGCVAQILKMRMRVSVTAAAAHWHWVQRSTSVT